MKIETKIALGIFATGICLSLEPLATREINTYLLNKSKNITSKIQLENLILSERLKIAPENKDTIKFSFVGYDRASSVKISEGKYEITLGGNFLRENALKHELYHVLKGHHKYCKGDTLIQSKKILESMKYHYFLEPQASIYAATGIKL